MTCFQYLQKECGGGVRTDICTCVHWYTGMLPFKENFSFAYGNLLQTSNASYHCLHGWSCPLSTYIYIYAFIYTIFYICIYIYIYKIFLEVSNSFFFKCSTSHPIATVLGEATEGYCQSRVLRHLVSNCLSNPTAVVE